MKNIAAFIESADKSELRLLLSAVEKKLQMGRASADMLALTAMEGNSRHLSTEQMVSLTSSFADWQAKASTPTQRRSRTRIWIAYLILRYGGLRLGEVLALDDRSDIKTDSSEIIVRGPMPRMVQMPEDIIKEIASLLGDPMFYSLRGQVLQIDPGYLRRKFYEQAWLACLSKELVNPRILRHSRAVELLGGGVPLKAVQSFLGLQTRDIAGGLQNFTPQTGQRIVQQYLAKEVKMKTSARNLFMGKVTGLVRDGLLAEVELTTLSGLRVVAVITGESFDNLRLSEGAVVTASIKAPWVVLVKPESGEEIRASVRNQFSGKVAAVKSSRIASEVLVDLDDGSKVCALVTGDSVSKLQLEPGADVMVLFRAFSVILNAE